MERPDRYMLSRDLPKTGDRLSALGASALTDMALMSAVRPPFHPGLLGLGYPVLPLPTLPTSAAAAVAASNLSQSSTSTEDAPMDLSVKPQQDPDAPLDLSTTRKPSSPIISSQTKLPTGGRTYPYDMVNSHVTAAALAMTPRAEQLMTGRVYAGSPLSAQPNRPPSVGNINALQCTKCPYIASSHVDYQHHFYVAHHRVPSPNTSRVVLPSKRPYDVPGHHATPPQALTQGQKYTDNELPRYHCPFCAWQCDISSGEAFTNHMNKHYSNPRYCTHMCSYCSREFSEPGALREHIFLHPLLHHYVCAICNIAYGTSELIGQHMTQKHRKPDSVHPSHPPSSRLAEIPKRKFSDDSSSALGDGSRMSDKTSVNGDDKDRNFTHSPRSESNHGVPSSRVSDRTTDTPLTVHSDSPTPSPSQPKRPRPQMMTTTLGQTIAKEIQAAISKELIDVKQPTVGDLLFMKGPDPNAGGEPKKKPLNLMSLLDRVVEQSLRTLPTGTKPDKPDLKFTVTFSDEEDAGVECDSTAPTNGEKSAPNSTEATKDKEYPSPPSTASEDSDISLKPKKEKNAGEYNSEETVTSSSIPKTSASQAETVKESNQDNLEKKK